MKNKNLESGIHNNEINESNVMSAYNKEENPCIGMNSGERERGGGGGGGGGYVVLYAKNNYHAYNKDMLAHVCV